MPIHFACLNNKTVIEAGISSHDPLLDGAVCVFTLEGKKPSETKNEYRIRLDKVIEVIQELKKGHGVDLFLLQNTPQMKVKNSLAPSFYKQLKNIEGFEHFDPLNAAMVHPTKDKGALVILTDKHRFSSPRVLKSGENYLGIRCKAVIDGVEELSIMNIQNNNDAIATTEMLHTIRDEVKADIIVGGDFNLDAGTEHEAIIKTGVFHQGIEPSHFNGLISTKGRVSSLIPKKEPLTHQKEQEIKQEMEHPSNMNALPQEEAPSSNMNALPQEEAPSSNMNALPQEEAPSSNSNALEQEVFVENEPTIPMDVIVAYDAQAEKSIFDRFLSHLWLKGDEFILYDTSTRTYSIPHFYSSKPEGNQQAIRFTNAALAAEFQSMLQQEAKSAQKIASEQDKKMEKEKAIAAHNEADRVAIEKAAVRIPVKKEMAATLIKKFKESVSFKQLNIPLDKEGNIPGLTLSNNHELLLLSQEKEGVLGPVLKDYKQHSDQIAQVTTKLYSILSSLRERIGKKENHHSAKALNQAQKLLETLLAAANQYEQDLEAHLANPKAIKPTKAKEDFRERISSAIEEAKNVFKDDLDWVNYLGNLLKKLLHCVYRVVSDNTLFRYKVSASDEATNEASLGLHLGLDDDFVGEKEDSPGESDEESPKGP